VTKIEAEKLVRAEDHRPQALLEGRVGKPLGRCVCDLVMGSLGNPVYALNVGRGAKMTRIEVGGGGRGWSVDYRTVKRDG
jgi:hypothetical protein